MANALCKFRGMLVIAEVHKSQGEGRCPCCGATKFYKHHGWLECECGDFSILEEHHKQIVAVQPLNTNLSVK